MMTNAFGSTDETWLRMQRARDLAAAPPRVRYTLDELVAQCDPTVPATMEDAEWLSNPPMGKEIL